MSEDKYPVRVPVTEVLRDFLTHKYGDALDITKDTSRLSGRENIMFSFLKECITKSFPRKKDNTIDSRLKGEYIVICDRPSLTPYQKKQIKNILHDYFKYMLFNHMAVSDSPVLNRKVKDFIETHNIFAENALDNILNIVTSSEYYQKTKRA